MNRLDLMRDRLPPIWSADEGTLTHSLLALIANQLASYDEDMDRVQRSHWVDTAFDITDLARIGALFQIAPAPWETESLFRVRLKATIAARLRGAVSRDVLEFVLVAILGGAQQALGVRYANLPATAGQGSSVFHTGPDGPPDSPAFVEFPTRRRRSADLLDNGALRRPLARITLENTGLFPVPLQGVIRGVQGAKTAVPLIANLTNGQVMVYGGKVACGQELLVGVNDDGDVTADLDGEDASADFFTGSGFAPGAEFTPVLPDPDPRPLMLERGENTLWVFPLALYDQPGLGSAVFAMPQADTGHGRWEGDGSHPPFDKALFEQPPAISFDLFWDEATPATFHFRIPAGLVRLEAGQSADPVIDRNRLFSLMNETVEDLAAAGTNAQVLAHPLRGTQRQDDRMRVLDPTRLSDTQPMTSRLAGLTALFDLSATDGARFE
jgi:hypothetical protein